MLSLSVLTLSFMGLAWFSPALNDFQPLFAYAGLTLAGLGAWPDPGKRPQLWLSGWVLLGLPILATAAFVTVGALGGLPWLGLGLLCFLSGQSLLETPPQRRRFIRLISLLILAESLLSLWQAYVWLPSLPLQPGLDVAVRWVGIQARPAGTFINPNQLAAFLILTLPLLAESAFWENNSLWKWLLRINLVFGLVLLVLTQSAAAILMLLLVLCFSRPLFKRAFPGTPFGFMLLPVAALVMVVLSQRGMSLVTEGGKAAWLGRLPLWQPALEAWKSSPWLGYGAGMTEEPYRQAQAQLMTGNGAYPHSLILQMLLMSGLAGLAGGGLWLTVTLIRFFRRLGFAHQGNFGLGVGVLACGLHGLVDIDVNMPEIWLLMLAMMGGVVGSRSVASDQAEDRGRSRTAALGLRPSKWISILASALCLLLLYRGGLMDWQGTAAALLVGGMTAWHFWLGGDLRPQDGLEWLGLAVLAYLGLAISWSLNFQTSLETVLWLGGVSVFFMIARRRLPAKGLGLEVKLQAGAAAILAMVGGSLAWRSLTNPGAEGFHVLVSNTVRPFFPNANLLGCLLLMVLPMALVQAWTRKKITWSLGLAGAILLFLVLSGSRGALAALLPALAWLGFRSWRQGEGKQRSVAVAALLSVTGLVAVLVFALPGHSLVQRFQDSAAGHGDPLFSFRPGIWSAALSGWKDKLWLGWGPGVFRQVFERVDLPAALSAANPLARHHYFAEYAHQEWLQWGLETGVVGFLLFLAWSGHAVKKAISGPASPLQAAWEAGLVAVLVQSLVDFNLHCPVILVWSAALLALRLPVRESAEPKLRGFQAGGAAWSLAGMLAALGLCLALSNSKVVALKQAGLPGGGLEEPYRAEWLAKESLALNPMDSRLWLDLAESQAGQAMSPGQAAKLRLAMISFQNSVRLESRSYDAHAAYSSFLGILSELKPQDWLEKVGSTDWRWENRREKMGQQAAFLELALEEAGEAEKDRPYFYLGKLRKARLLLNAGLVEQAGMALAQVTQLEPNCARAWEWRARLAARDRDPVKLAEALKRLSEIARIQPVDKDPYETGLKEADWDWVKGMASTGLGQGG